MPILRLYSDREHPIETREVAAYLRSTSNLEVVPEGYFFSRWKAKTTTAGELAALLINDFGVEGALDKEPSKNEISLEEEYLADDGPLRYDVKHVYEGFGLSVVLGSLIKQKKDEYHIVFTSRMFATWERNRYHGRTIICNLPLSIISTTGLVEAPVRPKEYYAKLLARQKAEDMGLRVPREEYFEDELRREFVDRMLGYDERLTEVAKGYALQAAAFFLTYDPFCSDPDCRLYNAHTQEELIHAQLESGRVCDSHKRMFSGR